MEFISDMEAEIESAKCESVFGKHLALHAMSKLRCSVVEADSDVVMVAFLAGSLFGNKNFADIVKVEVVP
jgi:hypothetical protein